MSKKSFSSINKWTSSNDFIIVVRAADGSKYLTFTFQALVDSKLALAAGATLETLMSTGWSNTI